MFQKVPVFIDGSPHAVTDLWDVGAHHLNIKFTCPRCQHSRVFHAAAVWWLFRQRGWNGHLSRVAQRFACEVCKRAHRRKVRPMRIELVKDNHDPLPLPPEQEWQAEAKRRR